MRESIVCVCGTIQQWNHRQYLFPKEDQSILVNTPAKFSCSSWQGRVFQLPSWQHYSCIHLYCPNVTARPAYCPGGSNCQPRKLQISGSILPLHTYVCTINTSCGNRGSHVQGIYSFMHVLPQQVSSIAGWACTYIRYRWQSGVTACPQNERMQVFAICHLMHTWFSQHYCQRGYVVVCVTKVDLQTHHALKTHHDHTITHRGVTATFGWMYIPAGSKLYAYVLKEKWWKW